MRVLAIGDIHGCCISLQTLCRALEPASADVVITLGDYIDRGPDSKGVIEHLLQLQQSTQLIPLRGNHEIMMLEARRSRENTLLWSRFGGTATLASYDAETPDEIPQAHWDFIEATQPFYEVDTHFFVHANADPQLALSAQPDEILYWQHLARPWFGKPPRHHSGKVMICGHTSQTSGKILNLESVVCIDTFAHGGMWLTCLEPTTGKFWQANESGQLREGTLNP